MSIRTAVCCGTCKNAKNLNDSNVHRYCSVHQEWREITDVCDNHEEKLALVSEFSSDTHDGLSGYSLASPHQEGVDSEMNKREPRGDSPSPIQWGDAKDQRKGRGMNPQACEVGLSELTRDAATPRLYLRGSRQEKSVLSGVEKSYTLRSTHQLPLTQEVYPVNPLDADSVGIGFTQEGVDGNSCVTRKLSGVKKSTPSQRMASLPLTLWLSQLGRISSRQAVA